jgi:hypothetical protein
VLHGTANLTPDIRLASRRVVLFYEGGAKATTKSGDEAGKESNQKNATKNQQSPPTLDTASSKSKKKANKANKKAEADSESVIDISSLAPLSQEEVRELPLSVYLDRTKKRDPEYSCMLRETKVFLPFTY